MSVDAILEQVKALSPDERAELRERLDADYADQQAEISPELASLLDERNAAADANPNVGYTLDEVIACVKWKR